MESERERDETALGHRDGLPGELLFLAEKYPRGSWRGRPALAGTGEMWLGNHDYFRTTVGKIADDLTRLGNEGETSYDTGPSLRRRTSGLLSFLDGHHSVEDHHYFPMFQRAEPRLLRGFEILEADHHMIHEAIGTFAAAAQDFVNRIGSSEGVMTGAQRAAVEEMAKVNDRFAALLRQHLADEEDIVIPLIIERAQDDPDFG